ncbi:GTP cyclohydrolase II [Oceanicella actignis]|uniref:GTP cyclohydrolase-2 n=1 Tax=Oceanicella actignis TaxID=1189325 RepID=A0A1M7SVM4_9RHOB|nr:GTP cyclohydrolase II [Oceanicella actignis]TYO90616.1 GTP cyclohydrolase II [Oceanicella actignis]SES72862.1 GTP cyclohydrolase II [Oceanicella actignis]SHN62478.1 GTP cyclohydrolase II [Oceanicella actignis]
MTLALTIEERAARARAELRIGAAAALTSGARAALIGAAEALAPERLEDMRRLGASLDLAITARRAETLKARAYDGDIARIILGPEDGAALIRSAADPASDLDAPLKGPFRTRREGPADLHRAAIRLTKQAHLLPAALVAELPGGAEQARALAAEHGLSVLDAAELAAAEAEALVVDPVARARVPLAASEAGRVHVFRPRDGSEEHYAVEIGDPPRDAPVLARLHSACFTGDVIGSLKCDCGPQLRAALARMAQEGAGVLLYLNQEGRGIGLANKMRAYSLQDQGFDTVEANHRIGFEDDERDFRIGATILRRLGFSAVRLLTNNPRKVGMMEQSGLTVAERVPLIVGENPLNAAYLRTKAAKSGHLM